VAQGGAAEQGRFEPLGADVLEEGRHASSRPPS
jgi:hypothetical protein